MRNRKPNSGMALVIVLGLIVILTVIVLGFMLSVSNDLQTSKGYESHAYAQMLSDSAVNLVISQVREASTDPDKAWASQPGLIHTYDDAGAPARAFKLYSSDQMVVDGDFDPAKGDDLPPPGWVQKPNLYTDLNSPLVLNKIARFPIVDGNGIVSLNVNGHSALTYDTDGDGLADVEGFSIDPARVSYNASAPLGPDNNPVPMPVKWIYLLKDGTVVSATDAGGGNVKIGDVNGVPTRENPVVARMAFWADDETAKVNLNTASEGTYWDTPIAVSQPTTDNKTWNFDPDNVYESDLAWRQGAQGEYQRYPGHPATTSLSPILGSALMHTLGLPDLKGGNRSKFLSAVAQIAPRIAEENSSQGGTARAAGAVALDADRLYATTDELRFDPERAAQSLAGDSDLGKVIERSRFFLTASSRAPEENLFNQPRVAVWPITKTQIDDPGDTSKMTAFDNLIAFCSTVGQGGDRQPFYFSRQDPNSPTVDWSTRNAQIYNYLQGLTGQPVPGFGGGTFASKYGADRDQILTEIFDYIRCTNLRDQSDGTLSKAYTGTGVSGARGQVVPIEPGNGTRGFGRIATISEMALVLVKLDAWNTTNNPDSATKTRLECVLLPELFSPMAGYSVLADDIRIVIAESSLQVDGQDPFNPLTSQPSLYAAGRVSGTLDSASKIGGVIGVGSLFEKANTGDEAVPPDSMVPNGVVTVNGVTGQPISIGGDMKFEVHAPANSEHVVQTFKFHFPSTEVPIPDGVLNPGAGKGNPTNVDPEVPGDILNVTNTNVDSTFAVHGTLIGSKEKGTRLTYAKSVGRSRLMVAYQDTVRSLVPASPKIQGDMRLVAGQPSSTVLNEDYFTPAKGYDGGNGLPNDRWADSLSRSYYQESEQTGCAGAEFGSLLAGYPASTYTDTASAITKQSRVLCPDIPAGIDGVKNYLGGAGDWDNGPGYLPDGPYLNKADEGVAPWDTGSGTATPYLGASAFTGQGLQAATFFSPNRQVPSPVMLGSLPTGVKSLRPWQTLLFRPARGYLPGGVNHPGAAQNGPPDHLLLDLFWMPVVEPYAISEPFSTAGKINLNYQIAPFTYIRRDTGLRAVLKSTMITALNPDQPSQEKSRTGKFISNYKGYGILGDAASGYGYGNTRFGGQGVVTRRPINLDATIKLIDETRFQVGKPFRSASEICEIPLVPRDVTGDPANIGDLTGAEDAGVIEARLATFWNAHQLTGDNSLERPYAQIYPRVTTKSNTYTVYVRVQTLPGRGNSDPALIRAGRDKPTGEFRGSFVIERYLDTDAKPQDGGQLGPYKFRVVRSKQFSL